MGEMDLPIDIQYDTGAREEMPLCETAYNEWLIDSMRGYQERTRDVQFR